MGIVPCYCNRHTIRSHTIRYICTNIFQIEAHFTIYVLFLLIVSSLYSCKSAKLSDAEEKQRIGEYYEAAAIYRKVYTKTSPKKRDLRGYIAYRMAECNRLINNTAKATSAYMNAIRYDYPDSTVYLRMGQMLQKTDVIRKRSRTTISIWRTILAIY